MSACSGLSIRAKSPESYGDLSHPTAIVSLPADRVELEKLDAESSHQEAFRQTQVAVLKDSEKLPWKISLTNVEHIEFCYLSSEIEQVIDQIGVGQSLLTALLEPIPSSLTLSDADMKKFPPQKSKSAKPANRPLKSDVRRESVPEKTDLSPDGGESLETAGGTHQFAGENVGDPPFFGMTAPEPESGAVSQDTKRLPPSYSAFPFHINEKVGKFIDFFQKEANSFFSKSLERSSAYEPMMKKIFREKNLPEDLFYLALIESGFNPKALSRAKAGGIWQFINKTAKRFGLKVDKWVDERRDPEKATYAAAEYLKNLFEIFNCWDLATASYNAGEGKVLRAMKKANSQDFWEISQSRHLKKETRQYVPMFLAAVAIAKDPQKYGFHDINYHAPLVYEKVQVPPSTSLALIAKAADADLSEIQFLNPSLKRGKTPPDGRLFEVKLPPGKREFFERNIRVLTHSSISKERKHRVRPGETLPRIAKQHRVKIQALCDFNGLTPRSRLKPGSTLVLPN